MARDKAKYNAYMREYMKKRYYETRAMIFQILGNRCAVCGATEDLEIDHRDWREKRLDLSKRWNSKIDVLLEELVKCQLLCAEHHKEKSRKDQSENATQLVAIECCERLFESKVAYAGHKRWCKN